MKTLDSVLKKYIDTSEQIFFLFFFILKPPQKKVGRVARHLKSILYLMWYQSV